MGFVCECVCVWVVHILMSIMFLSQTLELFGRSKWEGENLGHNWAYKIRVRVANYITSLTIKICINNVYLWICGPEAPIRGFVKDQICISCTRNSFDPQTFQKVKRRSSFISTSEWVSVGSIVCGNWSGSNFGVKCALYCLLEV